MEAGQKTGLLAAALMKVQATLKHAAKDSVNPHFKTKYADLGSVWDACREALQANGFAVAQTMAPAAAGWVCVETRLLHVSGEQLVSSCVLPVVKNDPQAYGSAITYGRRYGLGAMVGVIGEDDDDANAASARSASQPAASSALPAPRPAARTANAAPRPAQAPSGGNGAVFGNFGRSKGLPVFGAAPGDLSFYRSACERSLADPGKRNFHAKEQALLEAILAEQARQSGGDGEPPPHTDGDAF